MAGSTGLEPATSGLTVQCANQAAPRARTGNRAVSVGSVPRPLLACRWLPSVPRAYPITRSAWSRSAGGNVDPFVRGERKRRCETGPASARCAQRRNATLQRQLPAVLSGWQLDPRDPQLPFLRQQRQDGADRPFGQAKLMGQVAWTHRAEALQTPTHVAVDLAPPAVHNRSSSVAPDLVTLGACDDTDNP